jgi:hypothetical protein
MSRARSHRRGGPCVRRVALTAPLLTAVALLLAGCGGDAPEAESGTTSTVDLDAPRGGCPQGQSMGDSGCEDDEKLGPSSSAVTTTPTTSSKARCAPDEFLVNGECDTIETTTTTTTLPTTAPPTTTPPARHRWDPGTEPRFKGGGVTARITAITVTDPRDDTAFGVCATSLRIAERLGQPPAAHCVRIEWSYDVDTTSDDEGGVIYDGFLGTDGVQRSSGTVDTSLPGSEQNVTRVTFPLSGFGGTLYFRVGRQEPGDDQQKFTITPDMVGI